MVKSIDKEAVAVAPFLKKCYDMVDDVSTDSIISWNGNGSSFVIWNATEFSVQLLPKYFKHSNYSSFIRQLNIYGFRKIDTDRWEFANDGFIKGHKNLLKTIARRKHPHTPTSDGGKSVEEHDSFIESSSTKVQGDNLWTEVETLINDKNLLMQDLVNLRQLQELTEKNLHRVRTRIQGMEKNEQQLLSFLVLVMQNPNYLVQLLHPKENTWRMAEPGSIVEISSSGNLPEKAVENLEAATPVEEAKDFSFSPELMKALMDDNFPSLESQPSFFLPELSEERAWEQLLLCSPFTEKIEIEKQDEGSDTDMNCIDDYGDLDFLKDLETSRIFVDGLSDTDNGVDSMNSKTGK